MADDTLAVINLLGEISARAQLRLAAMGEGLAPALVEFFRAVIWEDQDECLQVRPEDIIT